MSSDHRSNRIRVCSATQCTISCRSLARGFRKLDDPKENGSLWMLSTAQLLASTSHVFRDLIWPLISAKTPLSLSPASRPCCSEYVSAWSVLRHTRRIVVELKDKVVTLYVLQLLLLTSVRSPRKWLNDSVLVENDSSARWRKKRQWSWSVRPHPIWDVHRGTKSHLVTLVSKLCNCICVT